jgi:hypothetical protein
MKCRNTIFHTRVGQLRIPQKKCVGTRYTEHVPLHHVGSAGHVVHFGASRALNVEAPFSCSGGTGTDSTKKSIGTHYAKLVLLHPV